MLLSVGFKVATHVFYWRNIVLLDTYIERTKVCPFCNGVISEPSVWQFYIKQVNYDWKCINCKKEFKSKDIEPELEDQVPF